MASDLDHLNPAQQAWLEKITRYGIKQRYGVEVTQAVIMIALEESDLGKYQRNLAGSSAEGPFQFMGPENVQNALTGYRTNHPEAKYAKWSAEQVFQNNDATMHIMFDQVQRWKQQFALGYLLKDMRNKLHGHELEANVFQDFNIYAYLRHNTSVEQTYERQLAKNGINESAAKVVTAYNKVYENPSKGLAPYKISAPEQLTASAELHVLHVGRGHVVLPNGFEATLTGKNDLVIGVGNAYLIAQGKNQIYVSEDGRRVETRLKTAFKDNKHNDINIRAAAGKMLLLPNGDAIVDTVNKHIAPFKLAGNGYQNADGEFTTAMQKPPLEKVTEKQHDAMVKQLASVTNDSFIAHNVPANTNKQLYALHQPVLVNDPALHAGACLIQKQLSGCPQQNVAVMKLVMDIMQQKVGTKEEAQHKV